MSRELKSSKRASADAQHAKFVEMARELETDDSPEEFERVFAKVVPPKKASAPSTKRNQRDDPK